MNLVLSYTFMLIFISGSCFASQAVPFSMSLEECKKEFQERSKAIPTSDASPKLDGENHKSFYLKSAAPKKEVPADFSTPKAILDISIAHDDGNIYKVREKKLWKSVDRDEFCDFLLIESKKCNKCLLMRWDGCC